MFECFADGPPPRFDRDAVEIMSAAKALGADFLVLHADWLGDGFFRLHKGIAGAIIQKFVTYGFRTANRWGYLPPHCRKFCATRFRLLVPVESPRSRSSAGTTGVKSIAGHKPANYDLTVR